MVFPNKIRLNVGGDLFEVKSGLAFYVFMG